MPYNPEVNNQMEEAARSAYLELEEDMEHMTEEELKGAERIIRYFTENYMAAGYKKLARKLIQDNVEA